MPLVSSHFHLLLRQVISNVLDLCFVAVLTTMLACWKGLGSPRSSKLLLSQCGMATRQSLQQGVVDSIEQGGDLS